MPISPPMPHALDDVVAEIASILAQGYLRHRKKHRISPEPGAETARVEQSQVNSEKGLDVSAQGSIHS